MGGCGIPLLKDLDTNPISAVGWLFQRLQRYASDIPQGIRLALQGLREWRRPETTARLIEYLVSGVVLSGINAVTELGDFDLYASVSSCV